MIIWTGMPGVKMAGELCIKPWYCFIVSLILVHILLPSTLSDEPDNPCDSSNDGVYLRDTNDCAVAYVCSVAKEGWLKITCPDDKWFDLNVKYCSDRSMVQCTEDGDAQLLISLQGEKKIYSFNELNGRFTKLPFDGEGKPNAMRYEPTTNKLYIAFEEPNQIIETDMLNSSSTILRSNVWCEGLEVDVTANLLFYTDFGLETVNSMTLTGEEHKQLIKRGLRYPRSIVADKPNRILYWIDITQERIERADYDGNYLEPIMFPKSHFPPRALDIMRDEENIKLYYCDEHDEIWEVSPNTKKFLPVYQPNIGDELLQCDSIGVEAVEAGEVVHIFTVYLLSNDIYKWDTSGNLLKMSSGTSYLTTGISKTIHPISLNGK